MNSKVEFIRLVWTSITNPAIQTEEKARSEARLKFESSLVLGGAALIMTILNIYKQYRLMAVTTALLAVAVFAAGIMFRYRKTARAAAILMACIVVVLFSYYALVGQNQGFAILWIILVPPIAMAYLGFAIGAALSGYFLIFLIVLFYTPVQSHVAAYYTETFCMRFPVLYLLSAMMALLLTAQKEYYFAKNERMAYCDEVTGLYNRRYYDAKKAELAKGPFFNKLTVAEVDINRLKFVNDNQGHESGDLLIKGCAEALSKAFADADAICRTGGDEFMILTRVNKEKFKSELKKLRECTEEFTRTQGMELFVAVGYSSRRDFPGYDIAKLEHEADKMMYADKEKFYSSGKYDRRLV